eukprot:sb/3476527/
MVEERKRKKQEEKKDRENPLAREERLKKGVHVGSLQALGFTQKKLTKLAHKTSYLDYSIPSFKVPGVSGALIPWEQSLSTSKKFLLVVLMPKHTSRGIRAPETPGTLNEGYRIVQV